MAILKSDIFHCSDSFERGNQFNSISDRTNLQIYKKIKEPKYQTWPKQNKKKFHVSLSHGPMLLNRILFDLWTFKYKFGYQKCIYIAGLEIEISRKLYLMYGHGGHLEK